MGVAGMVATTLGRLVCRVGEGRPPSPGSYPAAGSRSSCRAGTVGSRVSVGRLRSRRALVLRSVSAPTRRRYAASPKVSGAAVPERKSAFAEYEPCGFR